MIWKHTLIELKEEVRRSTGRAKRRDLEEVQARQKVAHHEWTTAIHERYHVDPRLLKDKHLFADQALEYEELIAEFADMQEILAQKLEEWDNAEAKTVSEAELKNNNIERITALIEVMDAFLEYHDIDDERNTNFLKDHPEFNEWTPEALRQLAEEHSKQDKTALLSVAERLESSQSTENLAKEKGVTTRTLRNRAARAKTIISALSAPKK